MRRQTPIAHLLHNHLFPHPTPNDPPSFSAHLARNLVPEVRIEVATFYGDLNSAEARYPGLDYCHPPHRMRLGRFKHHKRLFDAFDALDLTYGEIQDFCCWEGTKWARERYEKDEGVKVLDTTGDEIGPYVDRRNLREDHLRRHSITRKTDISIVVERQPRIEEDSEHTADESDQEGDQQMRNDEPDSEARGLTGTSSGSHDEQEMTRSIIAAWERGQSLSPEFEQYLKEQSESDEHSDLVARFLAQRQRYAPAESAAMVTPQTPRAAA